jgi:hypothetical protein
VVVLKLLLEAKKRGGKCMRRVVVLLLIAFVIYSCSGPALEELTLFSLGVIRCPDCGGTVKIKCNNCIGGYGAAESVIVSLLLGYPIPVKCSKCGGKGWVKVG